jgi:hypothetical protein
MPDYAHDADRDRDGAVTRHGAKRACTSKSSVVDFVAMTSPTRLDVEVAAIVSQHVTP